jgi:protein SCO1/2
MKRVFLTVSVTLVFVFVIWYGIKPVLEKNAPPSIPEITTATVLKPKNLIMDFALTDTTNKPFTEKSLLGQWTMMFFGYAQCPEICPKTLTTISELWKQIPTDLHFVFVSLDPTSDTVQILKDFLGRFNPNFIGLTGEEAVIHKLGKSCGIYSWQDPNAIKNDPSKPKMIDHSATLLLINPEGRLHAVFSPPYHPEAMAKDLRHILSTPIAHQPIPRQ